MKLLMRFWNWLNKNAYGKETKEDINLDEIDENFIISSFKTGGKVQASAIDTAKEKVTDVQEVPQEQNQPEQPQAEEEPQTTVRTKENRETGKGKNGDCRSTAKGS